MVMCEADITSEWTNPHSPDSNKDNAKCVSRYSTSKVCINKFKVVSTIRKLHGMLMLTWKRVSPSDQGLGMAQDTARSPGLGTQKGNTGRGTLAY
jgi:hypothetical protein